MNDANLSRVHVDELYTVCATSAGGNDVAVTELTAVEICPLITMLIWDVLYQALLTHVPKLQRILVDPRRSQYL